MRRYFDPWRFLRVRARSVTLILLLRLKPHPRASRTESKGMHAHAAAVQNTVRATAKIVHRGGRHSSRIYATLRRRLLHISPILVRLDNSGLVQPPDHARLFNVHMERPSAVVDFVPVPMGLLAQSVVWLQLVPRSGRHVCRKRLFRHLHLLSSFPCHGRSWWAGKKRHDSSCGCSQRV